MQPAQASCLPHRPAVPEYLACAGDHYHNYRASRYTEHPERTATTGLQTVALMALHSIEIIHVQR